MRTRVSPAEEFVERFAASCGIRTPAYELVDKAGESYLAIHVGKITEFYAQKLSELRSTLGLDNEFSTRVFLKQSRPVSWLQSSETQILQRLLAESLTVGRSSLKSPFFRRSAFVVGGEEQRVYSETNHVIFGRRGAGKSSLVLFACNRAQRDGTPYAWLTLQQYRGRHDLLVIPQVLYELVDAIENADNSQTERVQRLRRLAHQLENKGADLTKQDIDMQLPVFARDFLFITRQGRAFFIFVDDLHLLHPDLQPYFLSALYSFCRGNNVFLKITAIENLTRLFDERAQEGLQTPGDAQVIRLDYNLVNPGAAFEHIRNLLDSYVQFVGIPSLSSLCGNGVIERLAWVSAGVPRDALYIFNNAIKKAIAADRKSLAVMDINMSAADSLTEKEANASDDVAENAGEVLAIVNDIKQFCLKEIRCNAFLVHIDPSDERYRLLKRVSDLRFIHVLHPGITPEKAGEKYEALMLDYAFYTGFRKAPSVKEFLAQPQQPLAKELRKLKRYKYEERLLPHSSVQAVT